MTRDRDEPPWWTCDSDDGDAEEPEVEDVISEEQAAGPPLEVGDKIHFVQASVGEPYCRTLVLPRLPLDVYLCRIPHPLRVDTLGSYPHKFARLHELPGSFFRLDLTKMLRVAELGTEQRRTGQ